MSSIVETGKSQHKKCWIKQKKTLKSNTEKELLKDVGDLAVKIVKKFVSTEASDKDKKASMDQLVARLEEKNG